jgi:hypothetical protein
LTACEPNDFPPRPEVTTIVEFPTPPVITPTTTPRIKPMLSEDRSNATAFFYVIKASALAGNDQGVAKSVLYPIQVNINGQPTTITTQAEFVKEWREIFNDKIVQVLEKADEVSLFITFDGVRVANGELWFNDFCADSSCAQGQFLITQINN